MFPHTKTDCHYDINVHQIDLSWGGKWLLSRQTNHFWLLLRKVPKIGAVFLRLNDFSFLQWSGVHFLIITVSQGIEFQLWGVQINKEYRKSNCIIFYEYRIVESTSPSCIEAHAGLFRLLMKGIFDPYVLWPFDKIWFPN